MTDQWMAETGEPPGRARSSAWARQIQVEIASIAGRRNVALQTQSPIPDGAQAISAAIDTHLANARAAIARRPWYLRLTPMDWWRGTSVEQAYRSVHAARVLLARLIPYRDAVTLIPDAVARATHCLDPLDPRRLRIEKLAVPQKETPERAETVRAELVQALDMGYSAADEYHGRIRSFRNVLLAAALLIATFVLASVITISFNASTVPLCFHPDLTAAEATRLPEQAEPTSGVAPMKDVCPSAESRPGESLEASAPDIWIIAGLGLLGGALASAVSIRKITGNSSPYDLPVALALLKVPTGALTAVAGILLLGGNFVPGLSELDSQPQILAYALVFGYAQQIATRFIDDRATTLLAQLPSRRSTTATAPACALLPTAAGTPAPAQP